MKRPPKLIIRRTDPLKIYGVIPQKRLRFKKPSSKAAIPKNLGLGINLELESKVRLKDRKGTPIVQGAVERRISHGL